MSSSRDYLCDRLQALLDMISMSDCTDHEIADMIRVLENPETRLRTPISPRNALAALRVVQ